jgi:toxin ParE1/3/4
MPRAIADLGEIVRYISFDSPQRARDFGYTLMRQALSLGSFQEMGCMVPERKNPAFREIVHGSYRIIYRLRRDPSSIHVKRFWHAARGAPRIRD